MLRPLSRSWPVVLLALGAGLSQGLSATAGYVVTFEARLYAVAAVMAAAAGVSLAPTILHNSNKKKS